MNNYLKGSILVLLTAFISGVSVYINKYGVTNIDATLFTALKSSIVGLLFVFFVFFSRQWTVIKNLTKKQLLQLGVVGLVGGSIPFVLFFHGLQLTTSIKAGFIHKTLFIYVALLAWFFLREKISKRSLIGLLVVVAGLILFLKIKPQALALGDVLVLLATLFWSVEIIISKKLLANIPANIVALARMGFGAVCIWLYLIWQGDYREVFQLGVTSWQWIGITSFFLFGYVYTFYHGLKYIPAHIATVILSFGAPITALLTVVLVHGSIVTNEIIGILVILLGFLLILGRRFGKVISHATYN